ncbi:hypothetical protein HDV63DRAFT_406283 [Trichoderma sp. SZMC 28014]
MTPPPRKLPAFSPRSQLRCLVSTKALRLSPITAPQAVTDKDFCARKIPHIINVIPPPAAWSL